MKLKIDNCHYELVKDLLISLDSLVKNVEKDDNGAVVTLHDGNSQSDLMRVLDQDPLHTFCIDSNVWVL